MQLKLIDKLTANPNEDLTTLKNILDELPDTAENFQLRTSAMQLIAQINESEENYSKKISVEKIHNYLDNKQYDECLNYISNITDKLNIEFENDGKKLYRFRDLMEFCVYAELYSENEQTGFNWYDTYDAYILEKKVFCLFELSRFDEALVLCNIIKKLNPINFNNLMEIAEIYKATGKIEEFKIQLDETSKITWRALELARLLRAYGYYYIEKEEYEKAIGLLDVSRAFDSSEKAISYLNNEIGFIKLKNPDIKVLPPQENLKFLTENNLYYGPNQELKIKLMRAYKSLLKIMQEKKTQNLSNICATFATNFLTVTFGEQELLDLVEADVFRNKALVINKKFGYSFEISREWNEMNEEGIEAFKLAPNTTSFLFIPKDNKLDKTISMCYDSAFNPNNQQEFNQRLEESINSLKNAGYDVKENGIIEFANGLRVYRYNVVSEQSSVVEYFFKMRPDLLGCIACRMEQHEEIQTEILNILNSFHYLGFKKDGRDIFIRNFYLKLKFAKKNNQDFSNHLLAISNSIKNFFTARLKPEISTIAEEIIKSAIYLICSREETIEEISYRDLKEFLSINKSDINPEKIQDLITILINKTDNLFPTLRQLETKSDSEKLDIYNSIMSVL